MIPFTKTKIVATVGPSCDTKEMLANMIKAGVDVFRLNFSHSNHEQYQTIIQYITEINQELETNVGILADLQGPKIRIGKVENNKIELIANEIVTVTPQEQVSTNKLLYVSYDDLVVDAHVGDRILINDGIVELKVTHINTANNTLTARVIYGGELTANKGVNLPDTKVSAPALTPKDMRDLKFIFEQKQINWIALSFVRNADELIQLKGLISFNSHPAKVIAKIERPEAYQNIDEIIKAADAIMVARGDLAVELPLEELPIIQKNIVRKCRKVARPCIIATQMMESMKDNPTPTRAEITDVANAMYDGADALMLSAETSTGNYPLKVIEMLMRIIKTIEKEEVIYQPEDQKALEKEGRPNFLYDTVCFTATRLARFVNASSIIALTRSGYTAFTLASFRPKSNIFVFTESEELLNAVSLVWGTRAFLYNRSANTDTVDAVREVQNILLLKGLVQKNDVVVNTGSMPFSEKGPTNTIKLSVID
ncbi:MAG TPA: pyruvate kinase [Chitinophagales bacterium]|nr:pyruvate kinase [Chitinophagales bacterium]HRK28562.1 pyruvate kinase [Chitinophagales bacterium]